MRVKPHKWTKHHTYRVLHISGFITTLAILVVCCWVFGTEIGTSRADNMSLNTGVGVTVGEIAEGPEVVVGGSGSPHKQENTPSVIIDRIEPDEGDVTDNIVNINGLPQHQYVISSQTAKFAGHTNVKNALIHLEIDGKIQITGNVYANSSGDWVWYVPQPISVEKHVIKATATDQRLPQIVATNQMYFLVELGKNQVIKTPQINNTPDKGNNGNLFDVIISVPPQFKTIYPGDEVVAAVKFINFGSAGKPVDVETKYTIRNSKGEVILQSSQTIAVATQISILKTFIIHPSIPPGIYTITASAPSKDLIATATDIFEIKSREVAGATSPNNPNSPIDYGIIFQILSGMILLFSIVLYLEYNKVELISRTIHQISASELLKN